ncbi:MAG: recombination protein NinB, partial [Methylocella sp.]
MSAKHDARCPVCHRRNRRSNPQNARWWMLMHVLADKLKPGGISYSAETWHQYSKSRWLGCDDVRLPNGKALTVPRSTAQLDVAEFADLMTQVEAWAAERGVWLDDVW